MKSLTALEMIYLKRAPLLKCYKSLLYELRYFGVGENERV